MNTPICDFVSRYVNNEALRLHMPGHKGSSYIGIEQYDITEIDGADSLYEAKGIIRESELNAGTLFGADTFYSTEGSSLCIRAMLYLAMLYAKSVGRSAIVAAGRNAHKTFLSAAALLDFDVQWIYGDENDSYLTCCVDSKAVETMLLSSKEKPAAVYLTSPDYLGNTAEIGEIAKVCHKHRVMLLVDNAHGAYLKFLPESTHPIDAGADMCCDSAHKTLPVLTGGAYLHISKSAPDMFKEQAKFALGLFGSTSPSYLILQSLDLANKYLNDGYKEKISGFVNKIEQLKIRLADRGFCFVGDEPLKLTLETKSYGYTGVQFAEELAKSNVVCEFADPDYVVLMLTLEIGDDGLKKIEDVIKVIPKKSAICESAPKIPKPQAVMSVRQAVLSVKKEVSVEESCGRILASANVGCPPAVPIIVCGEKINQQVVECFRYYGIDKCFVI